MTEERVGFVFLVVIVLGFARGQGLEIISYPEQLVSVDYYSIVMMTCVAADDNRNVPSINWMLNDRIVTNRSEDIHISSSSVTTQSNTTGSTLTIFWSTLEICKFNYSKAEGLISCTATNSLHDVTEQWSLRIGNSLKAVELVSTPHNQSVEYGSNITMTCVARGEPFSPIAITFSVNGKVLDDTISDLITHHTDFISDKDTVLTLVSLTIHKIDFVGEFLCSATDKQVSDARSWELTFTGNPTASELVMFPNNMIAKYGTMIFMSCKASGDPMPMIIFTKDQTEIRDSRNMNIEQSVSNVEGMTIFQSIITISAVEGHNRGEYSCTALNPLGNDSQTWSLDVTHVPSPAKLVIVPQTPVRAVKDSPVVMTCVGVGFPPPTIMFTKNERLVDPLTDAVNINHSTIIGMRENSTQSTLAICSLGEKDFAATPTSVGSTQTLSVIGGTLSVLIILSILFVVMLSLVVICKWKGSKRNSKSHALKHQTEPHILRTTKKSFQIIPPTPLEQNLEMFCIDESNQLDTVEDIYEELDRYEVMLGNDDEAASKNKSPSKDGIVHTVQNEAYMEPDMSFLSKRQPNNDVTADVDYTDMATTKALPASEQTEYDSYMDMDMNSRDPDLDHHVRIKNNKKSLWKPMTRSNTAVSNTTYLSLVEPTPRGRASTLPTKTDQIFDKGDNINTVLVNKGAMHQSGHGNDSHSIEHTVEEGVYDNNSDTDINMWPLNKSVSQQPRGRETQPLPGTSFGTFSPPNSLHSVTHNDNEMNTPFSNKTTTQRVDHEDVSLGESLYCDEEDEYI